MSEDKTHPNEEPSATSPDRSGASSQSAYTGVFDEDGDLVLWLSPSLLRLGVDGSSKPASDPPARGE